jgi:hypothetical protein
MFCISFASHVNIQHDAPVGPVPIWVRKYAARYDMVSGAFRRLRFAFWYQELAFWYQELAFWYQELAADVAVLESPASLLSLPLILNRWH